MNNQCSISRSATLACLLSVSALSLTACHKQEETATTVPAASASIAAHAGLTVADGKLVLSAVPGNPAAAYFTLTNGSTATTIIGVAVDGTDKADMHETVGMEMKPLASLALAAGGKVAFAPGGKHVMVFGVKPTLMAGGTTKITFTLAGGAPLSAPLKVEAAGSGDNSMAAMKM